MGSKCSSKNINNLTFVFSSALYSKSVDFKLTDSSEAIMYLVEEVSKKSLFFKKNNVCNESY